MTNTVTEKMLKDLSDQLNDRNARDIKKQLYTPDHIYLDLGLCKDFTLGYVYHHLMTQTQPQYQEDRYQDILKGIPTWQSRIYDDFEAVYPGYGITNTEIEKALHNPELALSIFQHAPSTDFFITLKTELTINTNHSHVAQKYRKIKIDDKHHRREYDAITLYINTYPLKLPISIMEGIGQYFGEMYGVNVHMLTVDPRTLTTTPDWLKRVQVMYLSSIEDWTASAHIREELDQSVQFFMKSEDALNTISSNDALFFNKRLYSRRVFSAAAQERFRSSGRDFDYEMNLMTSNLNLLTTFEWIPDTFVALLPQKEDDTPEYDPTLDKLMALAEKG